MAKRPRYANNLGQKATLREQPWPKGHATRTTLAKRPRYANNSSTFNLQPSTFNLQPSTLQPFNLGQKATLREQPSTLQPFNPSTLQPFNPSTLLNLCDRYLDQLANFLSLIG
ncbi:MULTISPECIES: hypothetical protein [unclassified Moorena]|uniref:hypothetical protein n=1 Tax=unclassified Moorena TaxID=2683338 RepID=UPI0013CA53CF|nr:MULTISPECIES: hypothetical protein [unclassified Moorena]NEO20500.1 hypothetical protein [Moorena sp. SIO4A5]NEQ56988.1 hypothetical protein [Moorena sp. SIO4A1]